MLYDQLEYRMAAVMQGKPYRVGEDARRACDVPWGAEYVLEGRILSRAARAGGALRRVPRLLLGLPQLSGDRDRSGIAPQGIRSINSGLCRQALDRARLSAGDDDMRADLCAAQRRRFPEVVAVNALYTHGLVRHRFHEDALWRLCQGHRLARADHHTWARAMPRLSSLSTPMSIRSTSIR